MRTALAIALGVLESALIPFAVFFLVYETEKEPALTAFLTIVAVLVGIAGFRYSPPGKGKWYFAGTVLGLWALCGCLWSMAAQSTGPF